ncbi:larval cuticle protein A3A-like [Ischnura elegans]|uniref:larval cuticle protein A3A-like n=1 Tax=Ischnura elegans TaxID=197161 RepID=UPI001ED87E38|nr:larval cuticle protein A3A-like [Ischnura elegans]
MSNGLKDWRPVEAMPLRKPRFSWEMSIKFAFALLALAALSARAAVVPEAPLSGRALEISTGDFDPTPKYTYSYDISDSQTGDSKGQTETRAGDVVKGKYSVLEPDGALRTVYYVATPEKGFQAVIQRETASELAAAAKSRRRN